MRFAHFAAGTSLLALSACADLGFTDLPMANLPDSLSGPVQLTELEGDPAVSAEAPAESFQIASTTPRAPQPLMTGKPMIDAVSPKSPATSVSPGATAAAEPAAEAVATEAADAVVEEAAEAAAETQVAAATTTPDPEPTPTAPEAPKAEVGQCFADITIPAVTRETTEQVLVSEATTKTETIPATYKTVTEEVLVSEATTRTEVVPATYKTETRMVPVATGETAENAEIEYEEVTEEVLVKAEETREVEVPAVYENVTERVKVKDAFTEWRPGGKVYAIGAEALGGTVLANRVTSSGVMTLVEIPAEFENVTKRVLVTPASTRTETTPAEYETVTRRVPKEGTASADAGEPEMREVQVRVVDQPATVRTVPVAAEYQTVTRRVVDTPAMVRTVPVPAVYRDEVDIEVIEPARTERVEVICEANAVPDFIRSLQRALRARGLYEGEIDGKSGPATRAAIREFQDGTSDVLTIESARRLGLAI